MSATGKRPQLTSDELHQVKWLLGGALTLLALWTVFYMDVDAWTLMALTTAVTATMLVRPTWPAKVPPVVHTLAFPAIVAFFAGDMWLRAELLPAMVRLDMLLLLYRNLTYRQRRDDLQVIVLGLFLIVVAGVLTVSLVFAAQLLVYTACALAFLFTITLAEAATAKAAPARPLEPGEVPAWARHADWRALFRRLREVADGRVLALGAALFVGVVTVSGLLFLAIPRFQLENSMFLDRFISKKAKTGFSDTIRFGDVTEIQQDNNLALTVDVSDPTQVPASPYWRMFVLDDYREGTFRLSPLLRNTAFSAQERTGQRLVGEERPRRGPTTQWTFYLESGVSRFLPLIGRFEVLQFNEAQNFRVAPALNVIALRNEPVSMTAYRVEGVALSDRLPDPQFAALWRARRPEAPGRSFFLGLSLNESDRAQLARAVAEISGGPGGVPANLSAADFSRRAGAWLRDHHNYSLTPRIPPSEGDPLVRWLASREAGHCELFAGSLVMLARTAGFPARVVTGFKGGSWNGYSGNFTIRNSTAHAWAEVFEAENGVWLRTDPLDAGDVTQAGETRGDAALARRLDRSWSARLDSLRVFWYRRIVSFDQRAQAETLAVVKEVTQNSGKRLRQRIESALAAVRRWTQGPWDLERFLRLGYTAVLGGALVWWWRTQGRGWWRRTRAGRRGRPEDPVRNEAGRWLARWRSATADAVGADGEELRVQADLLRLRFGARETWSDPEKTFRRARHVLRAARRKERTRGV